MVYFQTKNPNLGKFCRALEWEMLLYFKAMWNIFKPFGIFYGNVDNLVCFSPFWYIVPRKIWQPCSQRLNREKHIFLFSMNKRGEREKSGFLFSSLLH
jgi:hypothetical protein